MALKSDAGLRAIAVYDCLLASSLGYFCLSTLYVKYFLTTELCLLEELRSALFTSSP